MAKASRDPKPVEPQVCAYYLLCTNEATLLIEHPVLPPVPTCQRCADKHGLTGKPLK